VVDGEELQRGVSPAQCRLHGRPGTSETLLTTAYTLWGPEELTDALRVALKMDDGESHPGCTETGASDLMKKQMSFISWKAAPGSFATEDRLWTR
jgi:hypothetical protein